MPRRKELKNIATGMCGWFISRNHDVDGYWGMGKLASLAQRRGVRTIRLDLVNNSINLPNLIYTKEIVSYRLKMNNQLAAMGIPEDWLLATIIEIDFVSPTPEKKYIPITTWGRLFKVTIQITDDRNKLYNVCAYGYCGPHDPDKETNSRRSNK